MTSFITRVELHDAHRDHYVLLHAEMGKEGFRQTIKADNGVFYHLPPAEYEIDGDFTLQQVLDKAKRAAAKTNKTFEVLVTQSAGSMWVGLPVVQLAKGLAFGAR